MIVRAIIVLMLFVGLALGVLHYRGLSIQASSRIQALRMERVRLQRDAWDLQMRIAALNSPDMIESRVKLWTLDVASPSPEPAPKRGRLAEAL